MILDIPAGEFAAYLFDLDGTLVDSMPVHLRAWDAALQRVGLTVPFDAELFYSLGGTPTLESAVIFRDHYGLSFDAPQLVVDKEEIYLDLLHDVHRIEPVAEIARRVALTHPVAVVTGGGPEIAFPALDATGLRALFPVVITPEDVARSDWVPRRRRAWCSRMHCPAWRRRRRPGCRWWWCRAGVERQAIAAAPWRTLAT